MDFESIEQIEAYKQGLLDGYSSCLEAIKAMIDGFSEKASVKRVEEEFDKRVPEILQNMIERNDHDD